MKFFLPCTTAFLVLFASVAFGKEVEISLEKCPAAVQATVREYQAHGKLDKIELEAKDGSADEYDAKLSLNDGRRIAVHLSADGRVIRVDEKKPKEPKKK